MILGQLAVVTRGSLKGSIGRVVCVEDTQVVDVEFENGVTLGFYRGFLKQISPLEGLARMVDYGKPSEPEDRGLRSA